jgi:hypothetical protein
MHPIIGMQKLNASLGSLRSLSLWFNASWEAICLCTSNLNPDQLRINER